MAVGKTVGPPKQRTGPFGATSARVPSAGGDERPPPPVLDVGDEYVELAITAGLTDLAVGRDTAPTWQDRREDYLFADSRVAPSCTGAKVVVTDKSDHDALQADFATPF